MKKAVLFILCVFSLSVSSLVSAQTFTVDHDTATGVAYNAAPLVDVHNNIVNTSGNSLTIKWKVVDSATTLGWKVIGLCDNLLCYPDIPSTMSYKYANPILTGGNMDCKIQFDGTGAAVGSSFWVRVQYVDSANAFNSVATTYLATKATTGVVNVNRSEDNIILYPNPAKDFVNVIFDVNTSIKNIAIYNLIGKAVSVYKVNGKSAKLDVDAIPAGVYFLRLLDAQGRIVATRKFTHQ